MKKLFALLAFLGVGGLLFFYYPHKGRTNFILISLDTLRADALGTYVPGVKRNTPNIDNFAQSSAVFLNMRSNSVLTHSSHMSIFTGLYPFSHKIKSVNAEESGDHKHELDKSIPMMSEFLKEAGYYTVWYGGKGWPTLSPSLGFGRGWDEFHFENDLDSDADVARVSEILQRQEKNKPFFLFLHSFRPHTPYTAPRSFQEIAFAPQSLESLSIIPDEERFWPLFQSTSPDKFQARPHCLNNKKCLYNTPIWQGLFKVRFIEPFFWSRVAPDNPKHIDELKGSYSGAVSYLDYLMGSILKEVDRAGLSDNTIIIITSDHGEEFYEHGGLNHFSHYEGVLRVPLIIHGKGITPKKILENVESVDILPTVLDLLHLETPKKLDGASLLSLLNGGTREKKHSYAYTWVGPWRELVSLVDGDKKIYVENGVTSGFYDLKSDPGEKHKIDAPVDTDLLRMKNNISKKMGQPII